MLKRANLDIEADKDHKQVVDIALSNVESYGIRELVNSIDKLSVRDYCEAFQVPITQENPTKSHLSKRLVEMVINGGLSEVLKKVDEKHVIKCLEALDVDKKRDAKGVLEGVVREMGLQIFLTKMSAELLNLVCSDLKIQFGSSSVVQLVTAITTGKAPEKKEKEAASPPKISKKKPALKKGVKAADVYQHYFKPELVEFCKAHDLPASGASKELIKRIIDYLEGDGKENESAAVNKKSTDEEDSEEEVKETKKEKKAKSVKSQEVAKGKSAKPQEAVAEQAEEPEGVPKKGAKVGKKTQPEEVEEAEEEQELPKSNSAKKAQKSSPEKTESPPKSVEEKVVEKKKATRSRK